MKPISSPTGVPPSPPSDALLDAFAAGTLAPADRAAVEGWLDAALAAEESAPLMAVLRATPAPACPPAITRAALAAARADRRQSWWAGIEQAGRALWRGLVGQARPAFAGAALVAVVALAGVLGRGEPAATHEAQAVAQALEDAHRAFAYLGAVNERASQTVRLDVLDAHIARPLEAALADPLGHRLD